MKCVKTELLKCFYKDGLIRCCRVHQRLPGNIADFVESAVSFNALLYRHLLRHSCNACSLKFLQEFALIAEGSYWAVEMKAAADVNRKLEVDDVKHL